MYRTDPARATQTSRARLLKHELVDGNVLARQHSAGTPERHSRHRCAARLAAGRLGHQEDDGLVQSSVVGSRPDLSPGRRRHGRSDENLRQRGTDHIVFSGDASTLGFEAEIGTRPNFSPSISGLAWQCRATMTITRRQRLQAAPSSAILQPGNRASGVQGATYPFAQRVGHVWLVGVNSLYRQLLALGRGRQSCERTTQSPRSSARPAFTWPAILVTHYPVVLASGCPEIPIMACAISRPC